MTEKELSGLYYLNRETERLQKEREEIEYSISVKSVVLSHAPKSKRRYGVEDLAVELADIKNLIQLKLREIQLERAKLERYIGSIEDPKIREIFYLRYVNGMKWREVGKEMHMSHASVFNKHKEYLKKINKINMGV